MTLVTCLCCNVLLCLQYSHENQYLQTNNFNPPPKKHLLFESVILKVSLYKHDNWAYSNLIMELSLIHNMWIHI